MLFCLYFKLCPNSDQKEGVQMWNIAMNWAGNDMSIIRACCCGLHSLVFSFLSQISAVWWFSCFRVNFLNSVGWLHLFVDC